MCSVCLESGGMDAKALAKGNNRAKAREKLVIVPNSHGRISIEIRVDVVLAADDHAIVNKTLLHKTLRRCLLAGQSTQPSPVGGRNPADGVIKLEIYCFPVMVDHCELTGWVILVHNQTNWQVAATIPAGRMIRGYSPQARSWAMSWQSPAGRLS